MNHLANWVEIAVVGMKPAKKFYDELLAMGLNEMPMGTIDYALVELKTGSIRKSLM